MGGVLVQHLDDPNSHGLSSLDPTSSTNSSADSTSDSSSSSQIHVIYHRILILWLKEYLRLVLLSYLEHQEDLHLHQHLKMSDHINQDLVLEHLHQLARLQVHCDWINCQYIFLSMLGYKNAFLSAPPYCCKILCITCCFSWHPPNSTKTSFEQGISTVIAGHHMLLIMFFIQSLWETKSMESVCH
ncbi:uncharacterized protein [Typha latifolia]|uniref:uncharacterized protein isoform X2 n=1 Tax=Typha latifolia TaxID=4733 RepID=UPI003C2AB21D